MPTETPAAPVKATTTPRARASRATTAKAAPAKAPAKAAAKTAEKAGEPIKVELEYVADTARYAKFAFPESLKGTVVGNVYAPLGTARVMVAMIPEAAPAAE